AIHARGLFIASFSNVPQTPPEVGELDELETFVGSKKTKSGCGERL
ncbi:hypothetical protein AVDCRST_MAG81-356, partial [uncultured Synechococcales cyanobacterium]